MKKWIHVWVAFCAILMMACSHDNNSTTQKQEEQPTEQQSTTEQDTQEEKDKEESTPTEKEEDADAKVIDRIVKHIQQAQAVDQDHMTILLSEQENYKIYEVRMQNADDPSVTNLLGMYRYFADEDRLEVYNSTNDTYDVVE
ncbi:hypothetical protein [Allofustis seminis]|uniref:hypothetical protein n=1 Tax=Allofustis seminis TaxID=166939 RepID=UPI00037DA456|nr:hypothetical protein [Allofustis seminis]